MLTYYGNYAYYTNYFEIISIDLGLANQRAAIAQEVDGLGPQFRQALRDDRLKYIKATYAAQPEDAATGPSIMIGQGKVVVEDD